MIDESSAVLPLWMLLSATFGFMIGEAVGGQARVRKSKAGSTRSGRIKRYRFRHRASKRTATLEGFLNTAVFPGLILGFCRRT